MLNNKPKLLLHTCCGVCSAWLPKKLAQDFFVTLYFFNPNIYPQEEYHRRFEAVGRAVADLNLELIEGQYKSDEWLLTVRDYERNPEGGERCKICFDYRLKEVAKHAHDCGYQYFATTLTVGRNKKADVINPIGEKWANYFGIKFLAEDFKKGGGQKKTDEASHQLNLYRQNYCGCIFSMRNLSVKTT